MQGVAHPCPVLRAGAGCPRWQAPRPHRDGATTSSSGARECVHTEILTLGKRLA